MVRLLVIDDDPVFRLGLQICLSRVPNWSVVAETEITPALRLLTTIVNQSHTDPSQLTGVVDLVILGLELDSSSSETRPAKLSGLFLIEQIKQFYPNLPILVLGMSQLSPEWINGVNGYCQKGSSVEVLVTAIRQIIAEQNYGSPHFLADPIATKNITPKPLPGLRFWRDRLRLSSLSQIEPMIDQITQDLQSSNSWEVKDLSSVINRLFLSGRRRELLAARWLVNRLLSSEKTRDEIRENHQKISPQLSITNLNPGGIERNYSLANRRKSEYINIIFDQILTKFQSGLSNWTGVVLEIDILKPEKKRELFYILLRKLEDILDELRFSQIQISQLAEKESTIIQDLWQTTIIDFFGKYYTLRVGDRDLEITTILLADAEIVKTSILDHIPLVVDVLSALLFATPLTIDDASYPINSTTAITRAGNLLENLLIQTANGVIQPLLNHFADLEPIKINFYHRRMMSTREVARFRNELSWRYRWYKYWSGPIAVFESQFFLFIFDEKGIQKISIYADRETELAQLAGIPLVVTYLLETRDAIAPRLRATITFLASGLVYLLTQVIGRGLGLIGRGIIQGIGNSLPESPLGKKKEGPK